jgi:protein SCO1/2
MQRRALMRALAGGVAALPGRAAQTKPCRAPIGPRDGYFPNVVLTTHENEKVRFYDDLVRGKLVVFSFMYTTCEGRCPLYTSNLVKLQCLLGERAGRSVFMYSISLDPLVDTPKVLNRYMEAHGIGPGWTFLTGKPADVELLRRRLGFVEADPALDKEKSNHIGLIRYGNEKLDRWSACPAMTAPREILERLSWMEVNTTTAKEPNL